MFNSIKNETINWLLEDRPITKSPDSDFNMLSYDIRPGDVVLVEGRSKVSRVIKNLTQSKWSHAALYIGRMHDIVDDSLREHVDNIYCGEATDQLLIEPNMGVGTSVTNLDSYRDDNLRICRPVGLTQQDATNVLRFALRYIGQEYNIRQILDLGRFLLPYPIIPRRWRSSLFESESSNNETLCSTMIASAFDSVKFPILPITQNDETGKTKLYNLNLKLYVPADFDTSPYFEIKKYPPCLMKSAYRTLPWNDDDETYDGAQ